MEETSRRTRQPVFCVNILPWPSSWVGSHWSVNIRKLSCGLSFFIVSIIILSFAISSYITQHQLITSISQIQKDPWPSMTCSSHSGDGQASGIWARVVLIKCGALFPFTFAFLSCGWLMMENRCVPQAVGVTVLAARMVVPDHQVNNIRNTGQATAASTTGLDSFHPTGFQILVGNAWVQGIDSSRVFSCWLPGGILTFFFCRYRGQATVGPRNGTQVSGSTAPAEEFE